MKLRILLLALSLAALCGCLTGSGWQGLVPGKDVSMTNVDWTVTSPWGSIHLHADGLWSVVATNR